jgi:hypothetical protein
VVCGVPRGEALGTAPKLFDDQGETNLLPPEPEKRVSGTRRIFTLTRILIFVVVLSLIAGGTYVLTRPKWNFEAKTILAAFKDDTEAMNRALELSCNALENVNEATLSEVESISSTISYDYRDAYYYTQDTLKTDYNDSLDD